MNIHDKIKIYDVNLLGTNQARQNLTTLYSLMYLCTEILIYESDLFVSLVEINLLISGN